MNQISISPTNPNMEDIGFDLVLRPEDIAALRRLQKLQAQDPANGWYEWNQFCSDLEIINRIWELLSNHDADKFDKPTVFRLNAFGRFVLAWTEGNAYVDITFNSGVK